MKQVIVMRTDLPGMATGKMCAQAAHASLGAVLPHYSVTAFDRPDYLSDKQYKVWQWLSGPFTKVVLRIDSEEALREIHKKAEAAGLITCLITDSGRTVFKGEPTVTCCAIGPDTDEAVNAITGELRPL